jgi:hypothetical protein
MTQESKRKPTDLEALLVKEAQRVALDMVAKARKKQPSARHIPDYEEAASKIPSWDAETVDAVIRAGIKWWLEMEVRRRRS